MPRGSERSDGASDGAHCDDELRELASLAVLDGSIVFALPCPIFGARSAEHGARSTERGAEKTKPNQAGETCKALIHSKVTEDVTEHVTEIYFGLRVTGDGRP